MDEERLAIVRARLTKAEGKIAAARADLAAGRCDDAASRAYYAMFHAARAMLGAKGLSARSHSGLAAVFGEHLVRSGEFDVQLGRWLGQGRRTREIGDYDGRSRSVAASVPPAPTWGESPTGIPRPPAFHRAGEHGRGLALQGIGMKHIETLVVGLALAIACVATPVAALVIRQPLG
jgi:hypothetical protein